MPEDSKFTIVKMEFEITQKEMDKYDGISSSIKTWSVSMWAALMGWSFQSSHKELLLVSFFGIIVFWMLDAVNKNFRQNYRKRRDAIEIALQVYGSTGVWPEKFVTPQLPPYGVIHAFRRMFEWHIFLLYVPLAILALVVYFIS